jgi:hypothetical protein
MRKGKVMSDKERLDKWMEEHDTDAILADMDEEETSEATMAFTEFRSHITNRFLKVV